MAKQKITTLTGFRKVADIGACYLAVLFSALGLVQIFLAGVGVFGRDFGMHEMLGHTLSGIALLVLIFALIARYSKGAVIGAIVLAILAVGANNALAGLGWDNKWIGGLHALSGIISVIVADQLGRRVFKKKA